MRDTEKEDFTEQMESLHPLARPALEAVFAAAEVCRAIQEELVTFTAAEKADRSPVTVADYASQAIVCRRLTAMDDPAPIVAEETSADLRRQQEMLRQVTMFVRRMEPDAQADDICDWIELGNSSATEAFWVLDPIDGTAGFLRREQYAIALAYIKDGIVQIGVLACPNLPDDTLNADATRGGAVFVAVKGKGAYRLSLTGGDWARISVDGASDAGKARFVESVESGHADHGAHGQIAELLGISEVPVRLDSQAKYGVVASGEASIYMRLPSPSTPDYRERIWDHAAGVLLVEEAGGRVTDVWGSPLDFGLGRRLECNRGVIVTNGALHEKMLKAWRSLNIS